MAKGPCEIASVTILRTRSGASTAQPAVAAPPQSCPTTKACAAPSAGISAGLDLALALIERLAGPRASACVARDLVAPVRRSGDEQQLSAYLRFRDHLEPGVHRAQDLIAQDPAATLKLTALARAVGMSERNLARRFREATGLSPGQYRTMLRLELAARLLKESGLSLDEVAAQSGWSDVRQLRRHWAREQGGSLRAARRR